MTNSQKKAARIITILTIISLVVGIIGDMKGWWDSDNKEIEGNNNRVNSDNNTYIYNNSKEKKADVKIDGGNFKKNKSREVTPYRKDSGEKEKRLAILPFENVSQNSEFSWLSKGISESLVESFSYNSKYDLIEAGQRDKILKEIKFQQGRYVDINTAVKIGKLLGASDVLIGSYQISDNKIFLSSRIINVQNGIIDKSSITTITDTLVDIFKVQKNYLQQVKTNSSDE